MLSDKFYGESRGFGFGGMSSSSAAQKAIESRQSRHMAIAAGYQRLIRALQDFRWTFGTRVPGYRYG
jgi:hypothetical protein